MAQYFNVELEKQYLSSAIFHPDEVLPETTQITEKDFGETNRVVFSALKACIASSSKTFSKFVLQDRLISLNIKIGGALDPTIYINSLEGLAVNAQAGIGIAKELKRWSIRREAHQIGVRIAEIAEKGAEKSAGDLVAEITRAFNEKVNLIAGTTNEEPRDLYGSIRELLEQQNVYDLNSILSPWPLYNDLYGGFDAGQVYCICARAKGGKSTWVMSMLDQIMRNDENFCALLMDTELTIEEVGFRLVSSLTGIKEYYIRHKYYQKRGNGEMKKKIEAAYALIDPFIKKIDHRYCGGESWIEQESTIRRWVAKKRAAGNEKTKVMVVYDYLKFDGEEFDAKMGRDLVLGKKANGIKNLAKELQIPIWALVQASRENEDTKAGNRISNGSVIADSDIISRLFSNIYLLQRLSHEQRANLGQTKLTDATHALMPVYTRQLGPESLGINGLVKYQEVSGLTKRAMDRWCENYICYSFNNFTVSEVGDFRSIYERSRALGVQIQPPIAADDSRPLL